jgi:glycosyltransferase involved in cell wall biosynthesis
MRSGFTILKNGASLGYPYLESLRSLAPFVDEVVVAHGDSTDGTLASLEALARELPCPLRIVPSPWDPANLKGGLELSRQTNIALDACRGEICLYLQSDELLYDRDAAVIRADLERFERDTEVEALAFTWAHFYGSFDRVVTSRNWYRREVRAVRKSAGLRSFGDAQGFRIPEGEGWRKPKAALSKARVLHYGWVRPPALMAEKTSGFDRLWGHNRVHNADTIFTAQYGMQAWTEPHPEVMRERVESMKGFDPLRGKPPVRNKNYWKALTTDWIERATGWRPGEYRNYVLTKSY